MKTKPEFAAYVAKLLRKGGDQRSLRYDADQFALVGNDGGFVNLGNVWAYYERAGFFSRGKIVRDHVRAILTSSARSNEERTFEDVRANLVLLVRSADYVAHIASMEHSLGQPSAMVDPSRRPIGERLFAMLGINHAESLAVVSQKQIEGWGQTADELFRIARFNLRMLVPTPFVELAPGLYVSEHGDYLDSGRLLLTEVVARLPVRGDVVAMVPNPAVVLVCGSEDEDGLARLAALAEMQLDDPKHVSSELVMLRGEDWVSFRLEGESAAARALRKLDVLDRARSYEAQRDTLQAKVGEDAYVARAMVFELTDGKVLSTATLTEGVRTYLPRTERVHFITNEMLEDPETRGPEPVTWEKMEELVGPLTIVPDTFPPRFFVDRFPDPARLAE